MVEVVGPDLDELLARDLVQPVGDLLVQLGAGALGEARVGDVADEDVLEAVRALARDRRAALAGDEVAQEQVVEDGLEILDLGHQVRDGALPEDPADHRGALQQPLLVPRQPVDAGRDHRLQRVGDPLRRGAALEQHPRRLLDEERVALRLLEQRLPLRRRELAVGEQRVEQLLALGRRERLELGRRGAEAAAAPARPDVEQLRPREAEDHQRRVLDALGEVLDQLEQRLLGPVDVLEDEDQRPARRRAPPPTRAPPMRSPAGCARSRSPRARRRRARAGRRRPRRRSTRAASRPPPGPGRRPRSRPRP